MNRYIGWRTDISAGEPIYRPANRYIGWRTDISAGETSNLFTGRMYFSVTELQAVTKHDGNAEEKYTYSFYKYKS
jgi:hypothetical protein